MQGFRKTRTHIQEMHVFTVFSENEEAEKRKIISGVDFYYFPRLHTNFCFFSIQVTWHLIETSVTSLSRCSLRWTANAGLADQGPVDRQTGGYLLLQPAGRRQLSNPRSIPFTSKGRRLTEQKRKHFCRNLSSAELLKSCIP